MSDQRLLTDDDLSRIREIRYDCDGFTASLVDELLAHIDALQERLATAEKDSDRLTILQDDGLSAILTSDNTWEVLLVGKENPSESGSLRAAIDAAKEREG